jgi:hypothetical protein
MFCAYCGKNHDESVRFTTEHVVPFAIGGSNAFTIRVCDTSNNSLGGLVDKPFIETFLVRSQRFFLGLSGTDGTEPTLDLGGKKQIDGKETDVTYLIRTDDSKQLKIASPTVTKTTVEDEERWSVSGDPTDVRRILEGKLKSLTADGKQMRDADGNVLGLDNLDAFLAASDVKTLDPSILKRFQFDWVEFVRFFSKLALATGHYVLGESFSRSARAEVLRNAMYTKDVQEAGIPGTHIWPYAQAAEKVLAPFRKENSHVLGVLNTEPPVFVTSLFGSFDAAVALGEPEMANASSASCSGRIFQIALPSREFHDQTLEKYLSTLVAERRAEWASR